MRAAVVASTALEIPEERRHAIVGALVLGLVILGSAVGAWYFLYYRPYMEQLQKLRQQKLAELNKYFTGPLATSPVRTKLQQQILSAETIEQLQAIDVVGAATVEWQKYQISQIKRNQKNGRVELITPQGPQLMSVKDAIAKVKSMSVDDLMRLVVKRPETVLIAVWADPNKTGAIRVGDRVTLSTVDWVIKAALHKRGEAKVPSELLKGPNQISGGIVRYILLVRGGLVGFNTKINLESAAKAAELYRSGSVDIAARKMVVPAAALGLVGRGGAGGGAGGGTLQRAQEPLVGIIDLSDFIKAMALAKARKGGGYVKQLMSLERREGIRAWDKLIVVVEIPKDAVTPKILIAAAIRGGFWIMPER
ncbi:MAG: DUF515 domain-containing protein [Euryarchaeota archaeon]